MTRHRGLSIAVIVASVLLLLIASVGSAAGATRFGAKLTNIVQPTSEQTCDQLEPAPACTWVMARSKNGSIDRHKAPRDGTIDKVRVISCEPGSFRLQIAGVKPAQKQAKVKRNGPQVQFAGDPDGCSDIDYKVNVVNVPNFHINKGEGIAVKAKRLWVSDTSGGTNTLQFYDPTLAIGGAFRVADNTDGLYLLVELQYVP